MTRQYPQSDAIVSGIDRIPFTAMRVEAIRSWPLGRTAARAIVMRERSRPSRYRLNSSYSGANDG